MTDAEYKRLTDALNDESIIARTMTFDEADKRRIFYEAAKKYAALLPMLAELVEAKNQDTIGSWVAMEDAITQIAAVLKGADDER